MGYGVVFITTSSKKEAEEIAEALVSSGVAACANIIADIKSVFMWRGKKQTCRESLLIIKTKANKFGQLKKKVKKIHSYEVPEIIFLPIVKGDARYLNWIKEVVR
jgi:periplasmic divalent cation tolerance protein